MKLIKEKGVPGEDSRTKYREYGCSHNAIMGGGGCDPGSRVISRYGEKSKVPISKTYGW